MSSVANKTDVSTLLGQYAEIINTHGVDSPEAQEFVEHHGDDAEFVELAETANFLRRNIDRCQKEVLK
jgi:hypothetical protein